MTMTTSKISTQPKRMPSHIPGLDRILGGGFFQSGAYIVQGLPGCGKTIFANQLCFNHVAEGGRALYVTLLAESHARMLQHLRTLSFFDESVIPQQLSYVSAFSELESEGLKGLIGILRQEMRARKATLLVLDGLLAVSETAENARDLKKFVHELQTNAMFHGCTVFMLTSGALHGINAERTMVDGLIELEDHLFDMRAQRTLRVSKFRGSSSLRGRHEFQISDDGLRVFPRTEALYDLPAPTQHEGNAAGLSSGIPSLDQMLAIGGLPRHSVTVLVGSTGTGKTTLGLHFLSQASAQEPGLLFGFFEMPEQLKANARSLGLDLDTPEQSGALTLRWHAHGEHGLDELAHQLLHEVESKGIKRLVIDGLSGFFESTAYSERIGRFFACLTNELRRRGVTTIMSLETRDAVGSAVPTPYGVSAIVDNLLFLRHVESRGEVKRMLSFIKVRASRFDHAIRELVIAPEGVKVAGRFSSGGDVLPTVSPVAAGGSPQGSEQR
jgi:circadian clock protein KaiC